MKTRTFLFMLLAGAMLAACDPAFDEEYVIDNQTDTDLTFVWSGGWRYYPSEEGPNYDGSYAVPAHSRVALPFNGGIGCTDRASIEASARHMLLGDSVQFVLANGLTLTYLCADTTGADSPYNFRSSHYSFNEQPTSFSGCTDRFTSLTYTVTAEQLVSAK